MTIIDCALVCDGGAAASDAMFDSGAVDVYSIDIFALAFIAAVVLLLLPRGTMIGVGGCGGGVAFDVGTAEGPTAALFVGL